MKDQRPYRATRAELRAIDEGLREKRPAPARLVRGALRRFKAKRLIAYQRTKAEPSRDSSDEPRQGTGPNGVNS
jgi:hypothetical protein